MNKIVQNRTISYEFFKIHIFINTVSTLQKFKIYRKKVIKLFLRWSKNQPLSPKVINWWSCESILKDNLSLSFTSSMFSSIFHDPRTKSQVQLQTKKFSSQKLNFILNSHFKARHFGNLNCYNCLHRLNLNESNIIFTNEKV